MTECYILMKNSYINMSYYKLIFSPENANKSFYAIINHVKGRFKMFSHYFLT
jgi:hypothetical protein